MPITTPFEDHPDRYDRWFERYPAAYESEVAALDRFVPADVFSVEIGVGTGRFAAPLDVNLGLDPAAEMLARASARHIAVLGGIAESLPFREGVFDLVLFVTTICFLDDLPVALEEARRVLRSDGRLVLGYVDAQSPLGHQYEKHQEDNPFYRDAHFVTTDELVTRLGHAGFRNPEFVQTIFQSPGELSTAEPVREGFGEGSFIVAAATLKPEDG